MPKEAAEAGTDAVWQAKHVYAMAVMCLVIGLVVGYLFRGSQSVTPPLQQASARQVFPQPVPATTMPPAMPPGMSPQMPSLADMRSMADKKAAPLLEKLNTDPKNSRLFTQVGNIYKATHQFKEAAAYYARAVQADPKNVVIRTEMASCLYYSGDIDGAITQLQQSLQYDPKDANSLFNLGMIKWRGKQDKQGALSAWRELLKSNPQLSPDRKNTVQSLIAKVEKDQLGDKGKGKS
jgi:cytochrome c-type biogenesis protein CcmH/NrfG